MEKSFDIKSCNNILIGQQVYVYQQLISKLAHILSVPTLKNNKLT